MNLSVRAPVLLSWPLTVSSSNSGHFLVISVTAASVARVTDSKRSLRNLGQFAAMHSRALSVSQTPSPVPEEPSSSTIKSSFHNSTALMTSSSRMWKSGPKTTLRGRLLDAANWVRSSRVSKEALGVGWTRNAPQVSGARCGNVRVSGSWTEQRAWLFLQQRAHMLLSQSFLDWLLHFSPWHLLFLAFPLRSVSCLRAAVGPLVSCLVCGGGFLFCLGLPTFRGSLMPIEFPKLIARFKIVSLQGYHALIQHGVLWIICTIPNEGTSKGTKERLHTND